METAKRDVKRPDNAEYSSQCFESNSPNAVALRSRHPSPSTKGILQKGPNFLIHTDGYDKLKPFGIAIHGAIDGYSRKILWLEASNTNNNPRVVARYFINYIRKLKRVPRFVRSDHGSENNIIKDIQTFLRKDHTDVMHGEKSFQYGPSTSNQRIEMLWSFFNEKLYPILAKFVQRFERRRRFEHRFTSKLSAIFVYATNTT